MTLRKKTFIIIGSTLMALIVVLYFASTRILMAGFARAEERDAHENVQLVTDALSDTLAKLDASNADWARWDATYTFIRDNNATYKKDTLVDASIAGVNVNLLLFVQPDGRVLFGTGFDLERQKSTPLPAGIQQHLKLDSPLLKHPTLQSATVGIIMLPDGPMMISARPILTSERKGPIRGSLIFGRFLNDAEIQRLSELTHYQLKTYPANGATLPPDFRTALTTANNNIALQPLNTNTIAGYTLIRDLFNKPALLLRVDMPRAIYSQGQRSVNYLITSLLIAGIAFVMLALLLIERLVLSRVISLSAGVDSISASNDLSQRMPVKGQDELAQLAGDINGMLGALQVAQAKQRENEELYREMAQMALNASDALFVAYPDSEQLQWHGQIDEMLGCQPGEFPRTRQAWLDRMHPHDRDRAHDALTHAMATGEPFSIEYRMLGKDESYFYWMNRGKPLQDEQGKVVKVIGACTDITERKALEERLSHQAFHDPLTNLPNRPLFLDRLGHALARATRAKVSVAVLFIDLDNFKVINDGLGHIAGDELLVEVAERLRTCLRVTDTTARFESEEVKPPVPDRASSWDTAARFGGDEFTILLDNITSITYAIRVADRIIASLAQPFTIQEREVFVTPSIGIAISRSDNAPADLLRDADTAMYEAKKKGRARYEVFQASLSESAQKRLELDHDLRRAIERNELMVYYQPKVDLKTGEVHAMEALVRWNQTQRGMIPPLEFVPIAEETGYILTVGQWVLDTACRQMRAWQLQYPAFANLSLSVNLSGRQLQHAELVDDIANTLQQTGLEPQHLILEITESVVMNDAEASINILQRLKSLGVRLAIDDFGTGYSSLAYLRAFPVDFLKIDRKFVTRLDSDTGNEVIVSSTISLAHALGLTVVAEGAETAAEVNLLRHLGSDLAQGYYFSKPLANEQVEAYLKGEHAMPVLEPVNNVESPALSITP